MKTQTLIGFDFGTKFIGVAVGQTLTKTAKALTSIKNSDNEVMWREIQKLLDEWQPNALIVGLPLNMDDTEQPLTAIACQFGNNLKHRFHLPVHFCDERLSTVEAKEHLFSESGYRGLSKDKIDAASAQIILESWMAE